MDNEIITRRRQIFIMIGASVVVFIGLVWLIAAIRPWDLLGVQIPTHTAASQVAKDCTHTVSYWKSHPELFPPRVFIGGVTYQETELGALLSNDSQELAQQIKIQLVVAFLNNQAGADQSTIEASVFDAYGWLEQHPSGSPLTEDGLGQGRQLFDALEAYNLGLAGVAACEATRLPTKTASPAHSATPVLSLTPNPTASPTASATPTLAGHTATDTYMAPSPTRSATRTPLPPVVQPTDTPQPPTAPPPPSNTPRPPDTPTSTPPPPPSPTLPPPPPTLPLPSPTLP